MSDQASTRLQPSQHGVASDVLGRAFYDDPLMSHFMPDDRLRARHIAWFMGMSVSYGLRFGQTDTTTGDVRGAAVWLPPGKTQITPWRMVQVGAIKALWRLGPGNLQRMLNGVDHFDKLALQAMTEPYWYLLALGVDPGHQGQGLGGVIIAPVLAEADAAGQPCYLETTKERNLPFYQRHGFAVVESGRLPDNGPTYWTMRRPAHGHPPDRA